MPAGRSTRDHPGHGAQGGAFAGTDVDGSAFRIESTDRYASTEALSEDASLSPRCGGELRGGPDEGRPKGFERRHRSGPLDRVVNGDSQARLKVLR